MTIDSAVSTAEISALDFSIPLTDDAARLLFQDARTAQAFSDEPVSDATIKAAWDLMKWGPTAFNSLPLRLFLVRTPEARQRLAPHLSEMNQAKTLAAPLTLIAAADPQFHRNLATLAPHMADAEATWEPRAEARLAVATSSSWLQIGYLIIALRAVGLNVGPMTGFDPAGVNAEFFADNGWKSLVVLNVGRPADTADAVRPRASRLDFSEIAEQA